MPTTTTQYNAAVAYNAPIRYDGIVTVPDSAPETDTGNRHAAVPWRNQRGRSNTFRRPSSGTTIVLPKSPAPKPEVTVSRAETTILATPDRALAEKAITEFVADRAARQAAQPELPETKPYQPSFAEPPKLAVETAVEQASARQAKAQAEYRRRERDDHELLELVSLLEGF